MKLYYDTLLPYFPDRVKVEENGQAVFKQDPIQTARRDAMIELARFQATGAVNSLAAAVLNACMFAQADLVDTTLSLDTIEVSESESPEQLVDSAAIMLFRSLKGSDAFDIRTFVAKLYMAEHLLLVLTTEGGVTDDK